jgi:hypothetical protein
VATSTIGLEVQGVPRALSLSMSISEVLSVSVFAGLSLLGLGGGTARAESGNGGSAGRTVAVEQADAILASRERAMGRRFDPAFRRMLRAELSRLPAAGRQSFDGPPYLVGPRADLVYTPSRPAASSTRAWPGASWPPACRGTSGWSGAADFPAGGCGVPFGPATSVILDFTAVTPAAPGTSGRGRWRGPSPRRPTRRS